ncbi:GNAT family N-acetyltransferase [Nonomuraea sp. NPDC049480]|uniref:GNAT family N-acetyltransferase n=1 Tax=Nonomuraea sp. NPDC049480 TaxID=3364353 RepID=UPI0037A23282
MLIRPRVCEDLDACVEALALVHAADRYPVDWPGDPGGWLTPQGLTGAWVAVEGGVVAGHVGLARGVEVVRLFVVPAARGGALAGRLLAAVRAAVGGPLELEVSSEGAAAIAFYERSGWRRVGSGRAAWLNAAGEPALVHRYVSS